MPNYTKTFIDPTAHGIAFHPISIDIHDNLQVEDETIMRLQQHKAVLESYGITSISSLGKLTLSGNILQKSGMVTPLIGEVLGNEIMFNSAYRLKQDSSNQFELMGGTARLLNVMPFPAASLESRDFATRSLSGTVLIDKAYWVADEIILEDNTNVVLQWPLKYLTIIAEKLKVGNNVTFTWEHPSPKEVPIRKPKPDKKTKAETPDGLWGVTGDAGQDGVSGDKGPDGQSAPELEIWVLEMSGHPAFDLKGQDGFQGGEGQDGGDGGDGSNGRDSKINYIWTPFGNAGYNCVSGPGNGGDGGRGGASGNGGQGGNGGHGGRLSLYAPQPVLTAYSGTFYITVDGGAGVSGGVPGVPGSGGAGGQVGIYTWPCAPSPERPRNPGSSGAQGISGVQGQLGNPGERYLDAIRMKAISADDFRRKLLEPAIVEVAPVYANEGMIINVMGLRFTPTDTISIMPTDNVLTDMVSCATKYINDKQLSFTVPAAMGGRRRIQIRQTDGTLSNPATLFILPTLSSAQSLGRIRPGSTVSLVGSGFAPNSLVRVNGQDMPNVRFIDPNHLEFTLIRPATVQPNAAGENVTAKVLLPTGEPSNDITLVLDTFRMLVLGDSIQWGQGLREHEKMHSMVIKTIEDKEGNIGVYKTVLAHSGATIGISDDDVEDTAIATSLNDQMDSGGEVPTSYPTILQQCATFTDNPETIDLVLLDGGINDVNVTRILNPFVSASALTDLVEKHCHNHMRTLLERITTRFTNAKVIVTGYYPIISEDSNLTLLEAFLIAAGVLRGGLIGGVVVGAIGAATMSQIVSNCRTFAEQSEIKIRASIEEVNNALEGNPRVFFAAPRFAKENAALASDPWIYGINLNLSPQDNFVAGSRAVACDTAGDSRTNVDICKRASVGHPNIKGAEKYAEAVNALLFEKNVPAFTGFADLHCHPMAHMGFGGHFLWGQPDGPIDKALGWCTPAHGPGGTGLFSEAGTLFMSYAENNPLTQPGHLVGGYPEFDGWPRFKSMLHQQMYIDWIKRAYEGGLRLICALAVNNELLAKEFGGQPPYDDVTAVDLQIKEMKNLVSRHSGWMEIAYSPSDARRIISQNKLAVILCVEVDSLGNWKHETDCTKDEIKRYLKQIYDQGVRQITPIHLANNAFGGCAIHTDMFNVLNLFLRNDYLQVEDGSQYGVQFRLGEDEGPVIAYYRAHVPPFAEHGWYNPPDYGQIPGGHVNVSGLTEKGEFLIKEMMRLGMLIDVDHMSQKSTNKSLDIAEQYDYPVMSSHTSFRELAWTRTETSDLHKLPFEGNKTVQQIERISRLGGVIAPISNQGDIKNWGTKVPNDCAGSSKTWVQAYLYAIEKMGGRGVAFGTDFNGAAGQTGPRFGPLAATGLKKKEGDGSDDLRIGERPGQIKAQRNGVRYNKPTEYYRTERWVFGDAYTPEQCDIWEAITLGRSHASINNADIRGNRGIVEVPARSPGSVIWIKNIAKGIRANSDSELPEPYYGPLPDTDKLLNYNSARVQRGAYYTKIGQIPQAYSSDPDIREIYDKVNPIWQKIQQIDGDNTPFSRSTAGKRDFDINIDGLAHYGLLPDFIQDLKNVGLSEEDLRPLLCSAEDYILMWEKCERRKSEVPSEEFVFNDSMLWKEKSGAPVYVTFGGAKFWIPNPDWLERYGGWSKVTVVPDGLLEVLPVIPRDGTVLREWSSAPVYVIISGQKCWIPDPTALERYGGWSAVRVVPDGGLANIPNGPQVPRGEPCTAGQPDTPCTAGQPDEPCTAGKPGEEPICMGGRPRHCPAAKPQNLELDIIGDRFSQRKSAVAKPEVKPRNES